MPLVLFRENLRVNIKTLMSFKRITYTKGFIN